ncbi:hypothetical protein G6F68_014080 [Rhizopus microsporus]|nr:hypothetical protein G6F68_014080 [Rhizopus microsporus]
MRALQRWSSVASHPAVFTFVMRALAPPQGATPMRQKRHNAGNINLPARIQHNHKLLQGVVHHHHGLAVATDLEVPRTQVPRVLYQALAHKPNGLLAHDSKLSVGDFPKGPQLQASVGYMTAGDRRTQRRQQDGAIDYRPHWTLCRWGGWKENGRPIMRGEPAITRQMAKSNWTTSAPAPAQ